MLVKKRMYFTIGLLTALTLGLLGGVALPAVFSTRELQKKIGEEQAKLDRRYALRRYVRNSVSNLIETQRRMGEMSVVALQEGEELDFIQSLEVAAAASGVEQRIALETVNQKEISKWEREIPLKLDIEGSYTDVLRHLNAIERLPYYVLVESILIQTPRSSSMFTRDGLVQTSVAATVYWQGADAPDFVRGVVGTPIIPEE